MSDSSGGYSMDGHGRETSAMPVIFATAGYDHTIRFWQPHTRLCSRTIQHVDSQVGKFSRVCRISVLSYIYVLLISIPMRKIY